MPKAKRKQSILQNAGSGLGKRQKVQANNDTRTKTHKPSSGGGGSGKPKPDAAAPGGARSAARKSRPNGGGGGNGGGSGGGGGAPSSMPAGAAGWHCRSVIDRQAAEAVARLLAAAESRSGGATIKSLTLAPHVVHKKPTFAVTCETLKRERPARRGPCLVLAARGQHPT